MSTAWVTLATTDGYAIGALVLAHSLRQSGTQHALHILYTDGVSPALRVQLDSVFTASTLVNVLDSQDSANLALIGRPDLGVTFTKLHAYRLTQYTKAVFLDADTLIIQNADELFDRPSFAAAPDIGWPDFFNSGVFVFTPSEQVYHELVELAISQGSFDGGDQGLLNQYYSNWRELSEPHRLPFIYNVTSGAIYSYAAALKKIGKDIKVVHFLGSTKPWQKDFAAHNHVGAHLAQWQSTFEGNVAQVLPQNLNPAYVGTPDVAHSVNISAQAEAARIRVAHVFNSSRLCPEPDSQAQLPQAPLPQAQLPQATVPEASVPQGLVPEASVPQVSVPEALVPQGLVPHHETPQHHVEASAPWSISALLPPLSPPTLLPDFSFDHSDSFIATQIEPECDPEDPEFTDKDPENTISSEERYSAWDQGMPDYTGRDAFDNIQKKIDAHMSDKH